MHTYFRADKVDNLPAFDAAAYAYRSFLAAALFVCLVGGLFRALLLTTHVPLIALANSYDEVRYTACFDLYPDRPTDISATSNSPQAPFAHYHFLRNEPPICYWSSELLLQGIVVAIYHTQQAIAGIESFSVRWLGVLKLTALLGIWLAFSVIWWRRGDYAVALANGILLPMVFTDPANTIYLNTFYAEWSALLATYTLFGLILINSDRASTTLRRTLLTCAAFALATSKMQHLLLPFACALIVLGLSYWQTRRWSWQGQAILVGALLGLGLQVIQLQRDTEVMHSINVFNRADVVFTGLLPNASDPVATANVLGLSPDCLQYSGKRAWQLPGYPEQICRSLGNVTRSRELAALLYDPAMALRLGWHGVLSVDPWLAPGLGLVEGGEFQQLPDTFFSISNALTKWPILRALLLSGPLLGLIGLWLFGCTRRWPNLTLYTLLSLILMLITLGITILGDGLADTAKQAHLITNTALAWCISVSLLSMSTCITKAKCFYDQRSVVSKTFVPKARV